MKNSILFLSFFSLLILGSCGTSYYSSSGYEDGIYYQPSSSGNELISAENKQLAELTQATKERSTEIVSRNNVEIIHAEDGVADVNVDLGEDKTYLVVMDDESYEERFEKFDDDHFNFSINLVVDSPWWYDAWYCNPWHYRARWSYAWYNPWYCGWYDPWCSPWYGPHYAWGWYDPWYGPWYGPHYAWGGWYDPWYGPYYPYYPSYPAAYRNVVYGRRDASNSSMIQRTRGGSAVQSNRYAQRQQPTVNRTRGSRASGLDDGFLPTNTVVAPTTEVNRNSGARRASSYNGITKQNENGYVNAGSGRRAIANSNGSSASGTASRNPMYRRTSPSNSATRNSAYINSNGSSIRRSVSPSTGRSTGSSINGRSGSFNSRSGSYSGSNRSSYNSGRSSSSSTRSSYSSGYSGRSSYSSGSSYSGRSGFGGGYSGGGYSGGGRSGGGRR